MVCSDGSTAMGGESERRVCVWCGVVWCRAADACMYYKLSNRSVNNTMVRIYFRLGIFFSLFLSLSLSPSSCWIRVARFGFVLLSSSIPLCYEFFFHSLLQYSRWIEIKCVECVVHGAVALTLNLGTFKERIVRASLHSLIRLQYK